MRWDAHTDRLDLGYDSSEHLRTPTNLSLEQAS